jgi:hypothetical protein
VDIFVKPPPFALLLSLGKVALTGQDRITRYLGCIAAFAVFVWRYLNAPQNWAYVGSRSSIAVMVLTLLPETVYPFVYLWVYAMMGDGKRDVRRGKVERSCLIATDASLIELPILDLLGHARPANVFRF